MELMVLEAPDRLVDRRAVVERHRRPDDLEWLVPHARWLAAVVVHGSCCPESPAASIEHKQKKGKILICLMCA